MKYLRTSPGRQQVTIEIFNMYFMQNFLNFMSESPEKDNLSQSFILRRILFYDTFMSETSKNNHFLQFSTEHFWTFLAQNLA